MTDSDSSLQVYQTSEFMNFILQFISSIKIWDLRKVSSSKPYPITSLTPPNSKGFTSIDLDLYHSNLCAFSTDGSMHVYSIDSLKLIDTLTHSNCISHSFYNRIRCCPFDPDLILSGSNSKSLLVWNKRKRQVLQFRSSDYSCVDWCSASIDHVKD